MTCKEKLKIEHPEIADDRIVLDCPDDYGYAEAPDYCLPDIGCEECEKCWDREVEVIEQKEMEESEEKMDFKTALKNKLAEVNREIKENVEAVKILEVKREVLLNTREMLEALEEHCKCDKKQEEK